MSGAKHPAPTAKVITLSHVAFEVSELDRSIAFYREVLGFEIFLDDRQNAEQPNVKGVIGGFGFGFELAQSRSASSATIGRRAPSALATPCLSFSIDNIERAFAALTARGCVEQPELTTFRGVRFFFFYDPDGQPIELIEFPPPITVLADLAGRAG